MPPRRRSPPATPLDNEDLVAEFLLRLPPHPSSLPRAAAVCKAWRRVATDPHFLRRFRAHHRTPPVLGFFDPDGTFFPTLEAPDRVSSARLSVPMAGWELVACRGGLILCRKGLRSLRVLDAWTGDWSAVVTREDNLPRPLNVELVVDSTSTGAGVQRFCFRLFALSTCADCTKLSVSVYSSDSGVWAHSVETLVSRSTYLFTDCHSSLVGNVFYWIHSGDWSHSPRVLQYNLETQTLAIPIEVVWNEDDDDDDEEEEEEEQVEEYDISNCTFEVVTKDGFLCIKTTNDHIWVSNTVLSSAENLVPHETVLLDTLLPLELRLCSAGWFQPNQPAAQQCFSLSENQPASYNPAEFTASRTEPTVLSMAVLRSEVCQGEQCDLPVDTIWHLYDQPRVEEVYECI